MTDGPGDGLAVRERDAPADRLTRLLVEHADWLAVERGLAANTRSAYARDLRRYERYLRTGGTVDPEEIDEQTVAAYVAHLEQLRDDEGSRVLAAPSVARAIVAVRSFHRFCAAEELLPRDPTGDLGTPPVPQGLPKALDESEVERLLGLAVTDDPRGLRDRAILETLYATGVRISELVGLDLDALDLVDGVARVVGKGDRERVVPVGREARAALRVYLERGRPQLRRGRPRAVDVDAVYLNARGGRLTRQGCWQIVRRVGARAGLDGRLSPHVLRHSCATHMLEHGADIRVVQELLGHASVSTTQVYTRVSPERLRAVYDRAHPRARVRGPGR